MAAGSPSKILETLGYQLLSKALSGFGLPVVLAFLFLAAELGTSSVLDYMKV